MAKIFTPIEPFAAEYNGVPWSFTPERTLVREGHELLDMFPALFREVRVEFDVEEATEEPGKKRAR